MTDNPEGDPLDPVDPPTERTGSYEPLGAYRSTSEEPQSPEADPLIKVGQPPESAPTPPQRGSDAIDPFAPLGRTAATSPGDGADAVPETPQE